MFLLKLLSYPFEVYGKSGIVVIFTHDIFSEPNLYFVFGAPFPPYSPASLILVLFPAQGEGMFTLRLKRESGGAKQRPALSVATLLPRKEDADATSFVVECSGRVAKSECVFRAGGKRTALFGLVCRCEMTVGTAQYGNCLRGHLNLFSEIIAHCMIF